MSELEEIKTRVRKPKRSKIVTSRLIARVLAFDQALGATGWVVLLPPIDKEIPMLGDLGTWRPPELDGTGPELSLRRAVALEEEIERLIEAYQPEVLVYETPMIEGHRGQQRLFRPESILMGATALRIAAARAHLPAIMIGSTKMKNMVAESRSASKRDIKMAVLALYPEVAEKPGRSEHVYDALGMALTSLWSGRIDEVMNERMA